MQTAKAVSESAAHEQAGASGTAAREAGIIGKDASAALAEDGVAVVGGSAIKNSVAVENDTQITAADAEAIRAVGRKSINDFTSEEFRKTEKWARKFYGELGEKSPFFRAWFGDWRAYDTGRAKSVDTAGYTKGQKVFNDDTGWEINVNRQVGKETSNHRGKNERNATKYLSYIDDITKKAILFDTKSSDNGNGNSLFFHNMYAYTDVLGYPALLKLQVEELFYSGKDGSGIIRRDYILQNIEEEQLSESKQVSSLHHSENGSTTISISDLYELVKRYDKDFHPKSVNPVLLNTDGTPKVFYHGASEGTSAFTARGGAFSFAENREDAGGYDGWYTDTDGGRSEVTVFSPTQIKSATDNVGTFDRTNADIRYSTTATDTLWQTEEAESDTQITAADAEAIRAVGRKSINDFTSEEFRKTEKWARKFYGELGEK